MKTQDILNHIQTNVPFGAELVTILINDPSEWASFDRFLQEQCNFDEFASAVYQIKVATKSINSQDSEPKNFTTYSKAFAEIKEDGLSEVMAKLEFLVKLTYEKNFKFLQEEIKPYLQELYTENKAKFDLRLNNNEIIEDPEYKMMIMLQEKLEFISEKIKTILNKKPVKNTVNFRKSKDVLVLIEALTS